MNVLGLTNKWEDTVPRRFVAAVFISAHRKLLTVGQASALCDLFEADYDLVRAAWEVFSMQGDTKDFTDTLRRIVRDLPFLEGDEGGMIAEAGNSDIVAAVEASQHQNLVEKDGKREALAAVISAKRELLKHSLEMMVKQELATAEGAASLYERALKGDTLVDAAVEAYAADRDVTEFLGIFHYLYVDSLTYAFGWSVFLCRIRFYDTLAVICLK
jgi:hypothetical protein